ncbi:hypothetical protein GQ53DRAFT_835371 [Thozetella sp. PMI_491]|nr:hypothetical protein GQ53DRAFT_835371 [Thozetella sp. PMI_491]
MAVLVWAAQVQSFRFVNNVNFDYCLSTTMANMTQDCNDTAAQFCVYDPITHQIENKGLIYLTEPACERLCGDGFGYWQIQDTLLRLFIWLVPTLVLLAHFHFAPLGLVNDLQVLIHVLGDPIDSMWSMLTRQEINRRFYQRAHITGMESEAAVAAIWSTYDELGLTDPSNHFFDALRAREGNRVTGGATHPDPSPARSATLRGTTGITGWLRRRTGLEPHPRSGSRNGANYEAHNIRHLPDTVECFLIEVAAQHLQSNRNESVLTTLVAILGLVSGLGAAFVRTWIDQQNNQTAHTIAIVCLLFNFIPIVQISSQIGAFTSSTAAVHIIQNLRRHLTDYNASRGNHSRPSLFPAFEFHKDLRWDGEIIDTEIELRARQSDINLFNLQTWPGIANFAGMNASWRPRKALPEEDTFDNHHTADHWLGFFSFFIIIVGSYVPALVISYQTPLKGFGCRSLSWTVILGIWLLSVALDFIFKRLKIFGILLKARSLWRTTIIKDAATAISIIMIIVSAQIGLLNSCWCRSGSLTHEKNNYVNLNPLTPDQFTQGWILWLATPTVALLIIGVFLLTVGKNWKEARSLLNRTHRDREQDIIRLTNLRRALPEDYRRIAWAAFEAPPVAGAPGQAQAPAPIVGISGTHGAHGAASSAASTARPPRTLSREPLLRHGSTLDQGGSD